MADATGPDPKAGGAPIYRRVSVRCWTDRRFLALSPLPPSGQSLWLYLLTGPHSTALPGLFVAGRAALAEALGWTPEAFAEAFGEVIGEGLAEYDERHRLWFLPRAIKHNGPGNPNVVKSWRTAWQMLPECALRDRAAAVIREALLPMDAAFLAAFDGVTGEARKPSAKPSRKPSAKASRKPSGIQEQEQTQQQEQLEDATSDDVAGPRPASGGLPDCPHLDLLKAWAEELPTMPQHRPELWRGARAEHLRARWREQAVQRKWHTSADGVAWFRRLFGYIGQSDFLTGRTASQNGRPPFQIELEWLAMPTNFAKVLEGKYHREAAA